MVNTCKLVTGYLFKHLSLIISGEKEIAGIFEWDAEGRLLKGETSFGLTVNFFIFMEEEGQTRIRFSCTKGHVSTSSSFVIVQ